jgi:hypothetical protein
MSAQAARKLKNQKIKKSKTKISFGHWIMGYRKVNNNTIIKKSIIIAGQTTSNNAFLR